MSIMYQYALTPNMKWGSSSVGAVQETAPDWPNVTPPAIVPSDRPETAVHAPFQYLTARPVPAVFAAVTVKVKELTGTIEATKRYLSALVMVAVVDTRVSLSSKVSSRP